jgi:2-C-methyl-D-erythritol 4-phosphate cytidylyltransferase
VVAAGRGDRLGSPYPKAFAKLRGEALLGESLRRLDDSEWIEGIVVVSPPEWEEPAILLAEELGAGKVTVSVPGGETRADSVRAGLAEVPEDAAVVLVHDAARPLVPVDLVEQLVLALGEGDGWDGAVPAVPVPDTLKRVEGDAVVETVSREGLVAVQTPQVFVASVLRSALAGGASDSDCAGSVERAGGRVRVVPGDPGLVKVTTADDLALVEALLAAESA